MALVATPASIAVEIKSPGGAYSPVDVRLVTGSHRQTATREITIVGGDGALASNVAWAVVPAGFVGGVAFTVEIDASALAAVGTFAGEIVATAGADNATIPLVLSVRPEGPMP